MGENITPNHPPPPMGRRDGGAWAGDDGQAKAGARETLGARPELEGRPRANANLPVGNEATSVGSSNDGAHSDIPLGFGMISPKTIIKSSQKNTDLETKQKNALIRYINNKLSV